MTQGQGLKISSMDSGVAVCRRLGSQQAAQSAGQQLIAPAVRCVPDRNAYVVFARAALLAWPQVAFLLVG
jgi:hypothetical protein